MHLDDYEARVVFHCLDAELTQRRLGGRRVPAAAVALRARLEAAIRTAGPSVAIDRIGTREAARILLCAERHVRRLAPAMGGTRVSGTWVFDREKVEEFARNPRVRRYRKSPRTD